MLARVIAYSAVLLGASSALASPALDAPTLACGGPAVVVVAAPEEEQEACAAVEDVLRHFTDAGLAVALSITIRFQSAVVTEVSAGASPPVAIPVMGRFHRQRKEVQVLAMNAPSTRARTPWTLAWNESIARSILRHEIAHAAVATLLAERYDRLPHAWHEALAYAVQIDLMDADLRARVLQAYPEETAFDLTTMINDFSYGFDPDGFAVRAYLTYLRGGRMEFVRKALAFQHDMIDLRDY